MLKIYGLSAYLPGLKGLIRDLRVTWTCEEMGIPHERISLNPATQEHKKTEYLKIHPMGKVPAIQDGEFKLFESAAICFYLADKEKKLIPAAGTNERAIFHQWVFFITSQFEPHLARIFGADHMMEKNSTTAELRKLALDVVEPALDVMDKHLADREFVMGSNFGIADIILAASCRGLWETELFTKRKSLSGYLKRIYERKSFQKAYAANGT